MSRHAKHGLFRDVLHGAGQVHLALGKLAFRLARRPSKQTVEGAIGHREALAEVEVAHVQAQRPVLAKIDQFIEDLPHKARLAVGRQAHHFVLARIHLEPGVVGERGVEETDRIGKMQLVENLEVVSSADADRRRRPLSHTIHRQDRRMLEW